MGPYDIGAPVPTTDLAFTLTDDNGNLVDVSGGSAVLTIILPDATTVTPSISNPSPGLYLPSSPIVTSQSGHHKYSWVVTGTNTGAFVDTFEVRVAPDPTIVSLSEAKEILKLTGTTEYDSIIRGYNLAATEYIEYVCGPVVTKQVTERVRVGGALIVLSKPPIRADLGTAFTSSLTGLTNQTNGLVSTANVLSYGYMYPISDLEVDADRGFVRHYAGLPFLFAGDPYGQYDFTYWAGRKIIPWGIYEAAKIILKHLFMVERGPSGGLGAGEEETIQTGYGFAVPARAVELLIPHSGKASRSAIA